MAVYIKEEITFHLNFFTFSTPSLFREGFSKSSNPVAKGQKKKKPTTLTMNLRSLTQWTCLYSAEAEAGEEPK